MDNSIIYEIEIAEVIYKCNGFRLRILYFDNIEQS